MSYTSISVCLIIGLVLRLIFEDLYIAFPIGLIVALYLVHKGIIK
jgi:hypothetical protein